MGTCIAYCIAKTFNFNDLRDYFIDNYRTTVYRDCIHVLKDPGEAFIFGFGVVVFWGLMHDAAQRLFDELEQFSNDTHSDDIMEEFSFSEGNEQLRIHEDHLYLTTGDVLEKIALSHGLAQTVKLAELEMMAQETIESTHHIPINIAKKGKTQLRRREIARMRGKLFLVETDINLNFELLDTPEFFWEFPEVEYIYEMTAKYLDVKPRIEILNKKLTIIRELLNMLADEMNHKHSAILEWIIIWLIAIEILLFLINEYGKFLK